MSDINTDEIRKQWIDISINDIRALGMKRQLFDALDVIDRLRKDKIRLISEADRTCE